MLCAVRVERPAPTSLDRSHPERRPHPQSTSIKVLLLKINEGFDLCTQVRRFLVEHPLVVLELSSRPVLDLTEPYGFDVERTVPTARWLSEQQRTLSQPVLQSLLVATVQALCFQEAGAVSIPDGLPRPFRPATDGDSHQQPGSRFNPRRASQAI